MPYNAPALRASSTTIAINGRTDCISKARWWDNSWIPCNSLKTLRGAGAVSHKSERMHRSYLLADLSHQISRGLVILLGANCPTVTAAFALARR